MSVELLSLAIACYMQRLSISDWVCRILCLTLRDYLQVGAGFWLRDPVAVRQHAEALAKASFADTKDPTSCALFYAALGRKSLLQVSRRDPHTPRGGYPVVELLLCFVCQLVLQSRVHDSESANGKNSDSLTSNEGRTFL